MIALCHHTFTLYKWRLMLFPSALLVSSMLYVYMIFSTILFIFIYMNISYSLIIYMHGHIYALTFLVLLMFIFMFPWTEICFHFKSLISMVVCLVLMYVLYLHTKLWYAIHLNSNLSALTGNCLWKPSLRRTQNRNKKVNCLLPTIMS